jgi:PhzF family phenazine biosynthesis protein
LNLRKPIYVVDVFTEVPLRGNPAGVVLDAGELEARVMQAIAAEMKHAETAFPSPSPEPGAAVHLRWFTPAMEVTFCGHATVGALTVLAQEAKAIRVPEHGVERIAFTCKAGLLHAELARGEAGRVQVQVETPFASFVPATVPANLRDALGLPAEAFDATPGPRRTAPGIASSVGSSNLFLRLRNREALARVRPDFRALASAASAIFVGGVILYVLEPAEGVDAAMRCFFPGDAGVEEDPVTGSAAGQLGALVQETLPAPLPRRLVFTQGDELGRPGRVRVEVRPEAQGRFRSWIGGGTRVVLRGELDLRGA